MGKRIFTLLLALVAVAVGAWAQETYNLWVGSVQVTSANASNVLGDGTMSYNSETSTLTFDNATITEFAKRGTYTSEGVVIYADGIDLTLKGTADIGDNNKGDVCVAVVNGNLNFDGNFTIGRGLQVKDGNLNIDGGTLTIKNSSIVCNGGSITIGANVVKIETFGAYYGFISATGGITVDESLTITKPVNGIVKQHNNYYYITNEEVSTFGPVLIEKAATPYSLWVGGVQVTSANASDLSVIDGVTGTANYDATTNTLTLNNAAITNANANPGTDIVNNTGIYYTGTDDITLSLTGVNTVTTVEVNTTGSTETTSTYGIYSANEGTAMTFTGSGSLTSTAGVSTTGTQADNAGIYVNGPVTIDEGISVAGIASAVSQRSWGVRSKQLTVNGTLTGTGGNSTYHSSWGIFTQGSNMVVNTNANVTGTGGNCDSRYSASRGIYVYCSADVNAVTINGGTVTATGGSAKSSSTGLSALLDNNTGSIYCLLMNSGTLNATGGNVEASDQSISSQGISCSWKTLITGDAQVTATGGTVTNTGYYGTGSAMSDGINVSTQYYYPNITIEGNANVTATGGKATPYGTGSGASRGIFSSDVIISENATVTATGGESTQNAYGISCQPSEDRNIRINGGTITAIGYIQALSKAPLLSTDIAAGGSTNTDGSNAVEYVAENNNSYKWFHTPFVDPGLPIDEEHFPDAGFRSYVKSGGWFYGWSGGTSIETGGTPMYKYINPDGDDYLSDEEIAALTELRVCDDANILSVQGIEYFTAMTSLNIENCSQLTTVDLSKVPQLQYLDVASCPITSLDLSALTALEGLNLYDTPISSIDLSALTQLESLGLVQNPNLTTIDVSKNSNLYMLSCGNNSLTALDVSGLTNLYEVYCTNGQLTSIKADGCTALYSIYAENNKLQSLSVNGCTSLKWIHCQYNQISETSMGDVVASLPTMEASNPSNMVVVDKDSENEGNVINTLQVAEAKAKNWNILSMAGIQAWSTREDYEGTEPTPTGPATSVLKFSHRVVTGKVGEKFNQPTLTKEPADAIVTFSSSDEAVATVNAETGKVTLVGEGTTTITATISATEAYTAASASYTLIVEAADIAIDEKNFPDQNLRNYLLAQNYGKDSKLTPTEIADITRLYLQGMGIAELKGIELLKKLTYLNCSRNLLTTLDLSHNQLLTDVYCQLNQIAGEGMDALIASLPTVANGTLYLFDATTAAQTPRRAASYRASQLEQNEVTEENIADARAKGWTLKMLTASGWTDMATATGIDSVRDDSVATSAEAYDLQGRTLQGAPAKKGVYIVNGRKVVVR